MKPVSVEVVTNMFTLYAPCDSCRLVFREGGIEDEVERGAIDEYPLEMKEEFLILTGWMSELARLYRHRLRIRMVDAKSLAGIFVSLRHRFRTYPAFVVDGKDVIVGWDREKLVGILEARMEKERKKRDRV